MISSTFDASLQNAVIANPLTVTSETNLTTALTQMARSGASELLVLGSCDASQQQQQGPVGIIAQSHLIEAMATDGAMAEIAIAAVMSEPIARSRAEDFFALLKLVRQHRHLCLLDEKGQFIGLVTPQSLCQAVTSPELLELRRVEEVMERQIDCAWGDATLLQLAKHMADTGAKCIVIVEAPLSATRTRRAVFAATASEHPLTPIGLITERDVIRFAAVGLDFKRSQVQTVMGRFKSAIAPRDTLQQGYQILKQQGVCSAAVCGEQGELVGVLTHNTILRSLEPQEIYKTLHQLQQEFKQVKQAQNSPGKLEQQIEKNAIQLQVCSQRERLLATVALRIRSSLNLNEILNTTVTEVRQLLQTDRVLIYRFAPDGSGSVNVESVSDPRLSILGQVVRDACFEEHWIAPYRKSGSARGIEDIETAQLEPCYREFLDRFDVKANLVVPILLGENGSQNSEGENGRIQKGRIQNSEGKNSEFRREEFRIQKGRTQNSELRTQLWGLLIAHECLQARAWQPSEIELLEQLAIQVAIAIQQATLVQQLQSELQERTQAEETIRFQARLLEAVEQAVITTDLSGKIIYWNRYAETLYGWTAEEAIGRPILEVTPTETTRSQASAIMSHLQQGESWCGEMQLQRKNGTTFYATLTNSPIYDENGTLIGIIGVSRDISDRMAGEDALRKSEERWQLAMRGANDGIWDWNVQTNEVFFSARWKAMLGFEESEIRDRLEEWDKRVHPDDRDEVYQAITDHFEGKTPFYITEHRVLCKDGRYKWILTRGRALWDENGTVIRMTGSHTDISDRQAAEEALRHSEEHLRLALETSGMGTWDWDIPGNQIVWSGVSEALLGLSPGSFEGTYEAFERCVYPSDREPLARAMERARGEGEKFHHEFRICRPDGTVCWIEGRGQFFYEGSARAVRMLGVLSDASDRKRKEDILHNIAAGISAKIGEAFFQSLVEYLTKTLGVEYAFAGELIEPDGDRLRTIAGFGNGRPMPEREYNLTQTPCETVVRQELRAYASDIQQLFPQDEILQQLGAQSYMGAPLFDSSGRPLGLLTVLSCKPLENTEIVAEILKIFAARASSELERKQLEQELEQFFSLSPDFLCVSGMDGDFKRLNPAFCETLGYSQSDLLAQSFLSFIHPDDRATTLAEVEKLAAGQLVLHFENRYRCQDGSYRWIAWKACPIAEKRLIYGVGRDITQSKAAKEELARANRALRTLTNCNQVLVRAESETELLNHICQILVSVGGYRFAWVGWVEYDGAGEVVPVAKAGVEEGYLEGLNLIWDDPQQGRGPTGTAARTGFPCAFQNIISDPRYAPWRDRALARGYASSMALPLKRGDRVFAVLNLYSQRSDAFDEAEVRLLGELTDDISHGIIALQTYQAHQESEARNRAIVAAIPDLMLRVSRNGVYLDYIPAKTQREVLTQERIGKHLSEILPPELVSRQRHYLEQALATGEVQSFEQQVWVGSDFYYEEVRIARISAEEALMTVRDITSRKQAEGKLKQSKIQLERSVAERTAELTQANARLRQELQERRCTETALRESEQRYATLAEVSPVGIFRTDARGNCLYVNERWCEIAGITLCEALGSGWLEAIYGEDRDRVIGEWERAVQTHQPFQLEYRFERPDGSVSWVFGQSVAETNAGGGIQGYVGSMTDISDRKAAEGILEEAERRWRTLLENVRLLVVGLDREGKIEYVNPFFLELTGYSRAEVLGKDWDETFLPSHSRSQTPSAFQSLLQSGDRDDQQNSIATKGGEEKIVAWNNTRLKNLEGEDIGWMSIGEDITERQAIERMKNEFISVVSHELRTPLTSIHGALNLLSTGLVKAESDRGQYVIQIAAESAERLVRLVNDILELERLESGKIKLVRRWVKVAELMRQAAEQMQVCAERAGITLAASQVDLEIYADGDRLLQVLTNLLSNAIKFSEPDSTVLLTATQTPFNPQTENGDSNGFPLVQFQVQDRGRGIPTDKVDSIFERFHQIDASDSRQKGGTGLGLAICRTIVEQHGGTIWVESILDEGSCFYFTVPSQTEDNEIHEF
ncbi:MAG: PAS domain S-box protein [Cyanobacteriota bacterium]|nr:PAS domain S-box protein [Cyanobacteriota bacterium]